MKALETDRLYLRPFQGGDLEDFYEYARNPKVGPNAGWPPHETIENSKAILNKFLEGDEVLALELKQNHKVIGSIGLHNDQLRTASGVKMLGYVLSEDYWGQGLTTEAARAVLRYAFEELGIYMVTVHHYSHNQRSKRVIEKCGFLYEGTLRHASQIFNGNIYDLVCYSLTGAEWEHFGYK